jgi:hypothetical protein
MNPDGGVSYEQPELRRHLPLEPRSADPLARRRHWRSHRLALAYGAFPRSLNESRVSVCREWTVRAD